MKLLLHVVTLSSLLLTCQCQEVSNQCLLDVNNVITAAQAGELWALHMLDSITKLPDGILYGSIENFGNYEECIQAETPDFHGLYCRVLLQISTSTSTHYHKQINSRLVSEEENGDFNRMDARAGELVLRAAVCAPSTCSFLDIQLLVEEYAPLFLTSTIGGTPPNVTAIVDPLYCTDGGPVKSFGWSGWTLSTLAIVVVGSMLVATVLEWRNPKHNSILLKLLSVCTSTVQMLSCKPEPGSMGCLHGLRALSMIWIMLGHLYEAYFYTPTSNGAVVIDNIYRRPLSMSFANAMVGVDTFFFISGLLLCYVFMREMKKTGKFNLLNFYAYRYIRLTMPILIVVLFYIVFLIHMGDGPNWKVTNTFLFTKFCAKNWWATLLYVNNYYKTLETCISQTWYTSVDMQLAWLSPLVLLPLYYTPRAALQLLALITAISCFIPFTITYLNNYPWNTIIAQQDYFDTLEWIQNFYVVTHTRVTPYVIGIVTGYFLYRQQGKSIIIAKNVLIFGWFLCTIVCLTIIYSLAIPYQSDYEYDALASAFYAGFHRLGWTLGLAWIVFTCVKGLGGPIDTILSWPGFQPLSKLSYSAYLIHVFILNGHVATFRSTSFYSHYEIVKVFFGDLPIIYFVSALLYIFVEAPTVAFLRYFLRSEKSSTTKSQRL